MTNSEVAQQFPPPVQYDLSLEDYFAMSRYVNSGTELRLLSWPLLLLMSVVPTILVAAIFPGYGVSFLAGICTGLGGVLVRGEQIRSRSKHALAPRSDGIFIGEHVAALNPDGVKVITSNSTSEIRWAAVIAVDETEKYIFLRVDTMAAHIIPKRGFDGAEPAARFTSCIRRHVGNPASA